MTKVVSTLDVFHALSTVVAQYKGVARIVKVQLSDLKLMRDCLATEIDENQSLQEQLKKEREAHKKDKELAAANYMMLKQERDGLLALLAIQKQSERSQPHPFDTHRSPPMVGRDDAWIRNQERTSDRGMAVSGDTDNAWDKQVGGDHYKQYAIQPAKFALANGLDYAQSNAIKYIVRHKDKNGVQDLDKAIHYIELLKQHHYKGE